MPTIQHDDEVIAVPDRLPLIPLREVVVFPFMVVPLIIAREASIKALEQAVTQDRLIFLAAQRDAEVEHPTKDDVHRSGVVARVLQVLKLPSGMIRALVEGLVRARVVRFLAASSSLQARVTVRSEHDPPTPAVHARLRSVLGQFTEYVKLNRQIPDEVLLALNNVDDPRRLADTMAAYLIQTPQVKQRLLETPHLGEQLTELSSILATELDILEIKTQIDGEVRDRIQRAQREFFLQEQMKVIKRELGDIDEQTEEITELTQQVTAASMPKDIETKALAEVAKLQKMHPTSPEATVIRNYLDWLIAVPWSARTKDRRKTDAVERILESDHYGLKKPKERVLEYLAVVHLTKTLKGPILCFVGPPGVGKTSLG
ncbi:MAG: LON peptidase substrate-binding domain-containing protein, partial [Candidatus Latescibacteria bacterium]|nr:LON peptidase substrate-binding domain-containing protein [Candidatus Latescibacterota bacterium]